MFDSSKKYILLLFVNIVVLLVWYFQSEKPDEKIFGNEYVMNLLTQNEQLEITNSRLEEVITILEQFENIQKNEVDSLLTQIEIGQKKLAICTERNETLTARLDNVNAELIEKTRIAATAENCTVNTDMEWLTSR